MQAAKQVAKQCPGVKVFVFSDRDIATRRAEITAALDGADAFFGSLLFDFDQVWRTAKALTSCFLWAQYWQKCRCSHGGCRRQVATLTVRCCVTGGMAEGNGEQSSRPARVRVCAGTHGHHEDRDIPGLPSATNCSSLAALPVQGMDVEATCRLPGPCQHGVAILQEASVRHGVASPAPVSPSSVLFNVHFTFLQMDPRGKGPPPIVKKARIVLTGVE